MRHPSPITSRFRAPLPLRRELPRQLLSGTRRQDGRRVERG